MSKTPSWMTVARCEGSDHPGETWAMLFWPLQEPELIFTCWACYHLAKRSHQPIMTIRPGR